MKIAIVYKNKVFLSQENFHYNLFQEYNVPIFVKSMKVEAEDFVVWLYHKPGWVDFLKYNLTENGEVVGEGSFNMPTLRPKTIHVMDKKGRKTLTINADHCVTFDITNYPFVFVCGDTCYVPTEVVLTRKIKSHGRDYMFLSWEGGKLPSK